jgi:hypothetical protein
MAKYDLTSALETSFTFTIGDKEFSFRKPTVREMRAVSKRFAGIDKETDVDKQVEMSDEAMAEIYKFCEPVNHDTKIEDVLPDQPIDVQVAFNEMIKKELGAS